MSQRATPPWPIDVVEGDISLVDEVVPLFDGYRRFYGQTSDPPGIRAFLQERFVRHDSVVFLARTPEGRAVGFVQLYPSFSSVSMQRLWILNDLFVVPEARRRGIARALMSRAQAFARESRAKGLVLETAVDNHAAQALYESLGWHRQTEFCTYLLNV